MEEIWKNIEGYEGYYHISNFGRVKSISKKVPHKMYGFITIKESIKKPQKTSHGYYRIQLSKNDKTKNFLLHRLIAIAFIPNPENKPDINHINSVRTDYKIENLEWVTKSENTSHAFKFGFKDNKGEKHGLSIFKNQDIEEIRNGKFSKLSNSDVGKLFNVYASTICKIRKKKTWSHI